MSMQNTCREKKRYVKKNRSTNYAIKPASIECDTKDTRAHDSDKTKRLYKQSAPNKAVFFR
ncbi:hypothetical protein BDV24DRAFT_17551 [Aspergillus arachidicola]|uniref:Uncharacterized protein n=1 Tax=Aspergillus arachidicola TaxID=656916 RepID=A0A5N6YIS8_9EURO|nr:hypothetical protein BDV24DRAFT_17551 [Aspergillus arachidicola]